VANWRKTSTPNVYVAHQQRCAAFRDEDARCSCAPSWRGRRPSAHHAPRPDAIFVARATPEGSLCPAGTAELGLTGEQRDHLKTALRQRHIATHRGAHRVAAGIWVDVDFHGGPTGPVRDAVMRAVRIQG
jgi:hypothetical protein